MLVEPSEHLWAALQTPFRTLFFAKISLWYFNIQPRPQALPFWTFFHSFETKMTFFWFISRTITFKTKKKDFIWRFESHVVFFKNVWKIELFISYKLLFSKEIHKFVHLRFFQNQSNMEETPGATVIRSNIGRNELPVKSSKGDLSMKHF